ncbi:phosphoribosylanthranilate isomerase [Emcibacter sp. SYSU 3D8]|uniref:phosphoribosylanthranilate isomerase n=1 Tax=Emcibacter sp. SYSU 3D8 TaxID=3133969 RepID=UPI0031FEB522
MTVDVKICGLSTADGLRAAIDAGAGYVGFVFYPRSPRAVSAQEAGALALIVPQGVRKVGLFVDPTDEALAEVLRAVPLDIIQLQGAETPDRVAEIRASTGKPVFKAVAIAGPDDVARAHSYEDTADFLLFDAKPPKAMPLALPGGNGLSFDWKLIAGETWKRGWILAGGLTADNVADAVEQSGARFVDVSSGVEDRPGVKNPAKIEAFIKAARNATS